MMSRKGKMKDAAMVLDEGRVRIGGAVGEAAARVSRRLLEAPFSSLEWLRADLTGEKVTEFDDEYGHAWHRPFKNYSGDISGRFLEAMALSAPQNRPTLLVSRLVDEILQRQHADGSFCSSGPLDWSQPIDFGAGMYAAKMMPALWGNSRMLCGLIEAARAFDSAPVLNSARRLGDFYHTIEPRFTAAGRISEYTGGDTFAAGYAICYYPAMEGLVKLYRLCGEPKYLDTAIRMAAFYARFDTIPIDHSHGMLCNQVGLLLLHEATGEHDYLDRVESRWEALVAGDYINAAGGILEKCRPRFFRDEGCALVDWLRLNLDLARITGKHRYWAMAERVLHNHLLQNQTASGGFGHRVMIKDDYQSTGFAAEQEEAVWCCTYHGLTGFQLLAGHLCQDRPDGISIPLALDFEVSDEDRRVSSRITESGLAGELFRQQVTLARPARVRVRLPAWARVSARSSTGGPAPAVAEHGGWLSTVEEVGEVTWVYQGGVRYETRHGLAEGKSSPAIRAAYLGPRLLARIEDEPPAPLSDQARGRNVTFSLAP